MVDEGENSVPEDVVNRLACGLTNTYLPDLVKSKKLLSEVVDSQRVIIETLQQENAEFRNCSAISEVAHTMDRARMYHAKLINIKREMLSLHEKTVQLKKRALKLQQQKQRKSASGGASTGARTGERTKVDCSRCNK